MTKKRAREIIRKVRKSGRIQCDHKGAQCPVCKYTYSNGLTDITNHVSNEQDTDEEVTTTLTVCSRCQRILVIEPTGLRLLNDIERMLLTAPQLETIKTLRDMARVFTQDQS